MKIYTSMSSMLKFCLLLVVLFILSISSYSQAFTKDHKPDPAFARLCLKFHNYHDGLNEFKALLKEDPQNNYYRWGIGYCHLHLNVDKAASIPYFVKVLESKDADQTVWYDLGEAYLVTNELDKAEEAFTKFIAAGVKDENLLPASRMLEMIKNARQAISSPVNVEITNLGDHINTAYPEFSPFVNANEKFLVFSAQNQKNAGKYRHEDGYYASDVYYSYFKFGVWKKKKRFSSIINTVDIEENGYLSANAASLNVYREDLEDDKEKAYYTYTKKGRSYSHPEQIKIEGISMEKVTSMVISPDNRWLVFSALSKRDKAKDLDLFYSKKGPDGLWQAPIAFDSTINTPYHESFPYFLPSGAGFFFASQGHNSMGGYDLFECDLVMDSLYLGTPKNLGYPVNTTMDDKTISFSRNSRYAYISSLRKGGEGDLDIYRVVFKDKQPLLTVIHGKVFDQDSTDILTVLERINFKIDTLNFPVNREYKRILAKTRDTLKAKEYLVQNKIPYEKLDIQITAIHKNSKKEAGNFVVQENTGRYVVILPPGEYKLIFSRKDFETKYISNIIIDDYDQRNREMELHILMQKK